MALKGLFSKKREPQDDRQVGVAQLSDGERLALLDELEHCGLGWFWSTDASGKIAYMSSALAEKIAPVFPEIRGRALTEIFQPVEEDGRSSPLALKLGARKSFSQLRVRLCGQGGEGEGAVVLSLSGRPMVDRSGNFAGFRGTGTDVTEQYHREAETARLAKFDSLTGLANRHRMAHKIETTLKAFLPAKRHCAVMMLDLDRFKQVNDTLGHAAGDELLKQVASRIKSVVHSGEIGRLGGDEFQIMIPDLDDRGELGDIAMKLITILSQPYALEEGRCVIGASVGIAIAPHDGVTREEITHSADLALYAAKNSGRGQYRFYSGDLANEALFRKRLEGHLAQALREDQLFVKFEPRLNIADQQVAAIEAHVCWNHPERGLIDEEEFRSIVKGSPLQYEIAQWLLGHVCAQAAGLPESLRMVIGVSPRQFGADGFVDSVAAALADSGLDPARLELAVSEEIFLADDARVRSTLAALFKLGLRMTLKDFGTGYSSLEFLRGAPFDALQIGEKFLPGDDANDERTVELLRAIVALARAMGMDTIACGIESYDIIALLEEAGVSQAQGPIYSEALSFDEVTANVEDGSWRIEPAVGRHKRARRRTVFRKVQVIHDDYSYEVTLRNLSRTGALIEGLVDVPKGTQFVVDLGGGQLAVATVIRSSGDTQGLEFEVPLIDDGAGGLCTRHRVSPYELAAAGAPLAPLASGDYKAMPGGLLSANMGAPRFAYSNARGSGQ